MEHLAACLYIPTACVEQAKLIFAVYRHVKEAVHNFKAVVGACLALAYRELGKCKRNQPSHLRKGRCIHRHVVFGWAC